MKRLLNVIFFIFLISFSFVIVYAEDDDLSPTSNSQIAKQKETIENYCDKNKKIDGCIYDKNNSIYTKSSKLNFSHISSNYESGNADYGPATFNFPADIPLTRGYQAFDGNGDAVFAGCYRYVNNNDSSNLAKGTYFLFEIIKGNCGVKDSFVVPSKGTNICFCNWASTSINNCECNSNAGTYNGKNQMLREFSIHTSAANINNWTAVDNGDCPKVFGYTANTRWYTTLKNKYIFSDNKGDFNIGTISFWGREEYVGRPGCTVEDTDGNEKAQELLNGVLSEINNKQCPSKIEDMNSFQDDFENWYNSLRNNNDYRVLWSAGLIDSVTKKSAQEQINDAIKSKISDCQYKICDITNEQKNKIEQNLGSSCKNGCGLSNVRTQSDNETAKCYCCGSSSQGCTYEWTESPGNSCSLQDSVPKTQCIGTTKDLECRNCLNEAYVKAGLSDKQKICMAGSDIAKLLTEQNLRKANEEAANADVAKEIEENKQTREDIFNKMGKKPTIKEFGFGQNTMTCAQILGPNLTKLVHAGITAIQIIGAILAIVKGMITLIPAIMAKDADALKKAQKTLVLMAIVLLCIFLLRYLIRWIGNILGYDISCLV